MWVRFDLQKPSHYLRLGWWETKVCFEKALQCMCHGNSSKETFIAWQALPLTSLSKSQRKLFCFHKAAPAERCVIGWFNFGKIKTCSKKEVTSILQKRKGNYEKMTARSLNIVELHAPTHRLLLIYIFLFCFVFCFFSYRTRSLCRRAKARNVCFVSLLTR